MSAGLKTIDFPISNMMRYSLFVPRLYNWCRSLGFEAGKIMPSRAFCSDENQGFPIILICKHFGAYPFNYGRVGGVVATDLHGPLAHHGKDIVVIHASHVGYDPDSGLFGEYCRLQTPENQKTSACGKIGHIISKYQKEYEYAQNNIRLGMMQDQAVVIIDKQLLDKNRQGLQLKLDSLVNMKEGQARVIKNLSTTCVFEAKGELIRSLPEKMWHQGCVIGSYLKTAYFGFNSKVDLDVEEPNYLENNLLQSMGQILTSEQPLLTAAQLNVRAEFDRAWRSIKSAADFKNKNLLLISGLNIDISPEPGWMFPLTKNVPWAAYIQKSNGESKTLEQDELFQILIEQSTENPDQVELEQAISKMINAPEVKIKT